VNHGKVNATLPKSTDPETLTLEQAVQLIDAKAASSPAKPARGGARKAASADGEKAAPKKAAAKKPAAKSSATKKPAAPKKPAAKKAAASKPDAAE
jgi:DNA topoisomerase-1